MKKIISTKILKKWGDSFVITLSSEDIAILDLKKGDVIKITVEKNSDK